MHAFRAYDWQNNQDQCAQRDCSYAELSEENIFERQDNENEIACKYSSIPLASGDQLCRYYLSKMNTNSKDEMKNEPEALETKSRGVENVCQTSKSKFSSKNDPIHKLGSFQAFCAIMKQYISVGALTLPFMFYLTGYLLGSIIILGVGLMTVYSIDLIHFVSYDLSQKNPNGPTAHSLGDLTLLLLGPSAQVLFRIFSFISNYGSCIAYMIFFELYIASLVQQHWSHKLSNQEAHLIGGLSAFAILLPLSTINRREMVSNANIIGLLAGLTAMSIMIYSELKLIHQTASIHIDESKLWQTESLGVSLGIAFFSFKITGISINIRTKMNRTEDFPCVMLSATAITCIIYLFFGIITQLALGEYTQEIVLLNFAPQTLKGSLARLLYAISVLLAYPMKFDIVVSVYENFSIFKEKIFDKEKEFDTEFQFNFAKLKRYSIRFVLIIVVFLFTLITDRLSQVIALVGSLGGILNQFILPQALYMKYTFSKISWLRISFGLLISAFSVVVSVFGIFKSL